VRRTLVLNEEDLVMVVKEDIVKQIDENRGEMNRTEFVNFLIQAQLKECFKEQSYVTKAELKQFTQEITQLLHNFLEFFVSYGMSLGKRPQNNEFQSLTQQLDDIDKPGEERKRF
jgi:hypothetical protein